MSRLRSYNRLGSASRECTLLPLSDLWLLLEAKYLFDKMWKSTKEMYIFRTGELHLLFERKGRPLQNGKQMETRLPWKDKMGVFRIAKFICQNFTFSCQAECTFKMEWVGMMSHTQLDCQMSNPGTALFANDQIKDYPSLPDSAIHILAIFQPYFSHISVIFQPYFSHIFQAYMGYI